MELDLNDDQLNSLRFHAYENVRQNFLSFVKGFAPKLVADFKMGRHIEVISQKLQEIEEGKVKRLMVLFYQMMILDQMISDQLEF